MARTTKLVRPQEGRIIAGVCAGIGNYFGINPWIARLLFLFVPGPNLLVYLVMWFIMPEEDTLEV
jgi:phage shock protein C